MRTVLFASLRTYARRYAAAVVAVVAAVALIVVTNALTSATKSGLQAGLDQPFKNAAGGIENPDPDRVDSYVKQGAWPIAMNYEAVRTETAQLGDDVTVGTVSTEKRWQWQTLEGGRFPTASGEAVADADAAETNNVAVGDTIRVGEGAKAAKVTVVGLVEAPQMWSANLYVTWSQMQQWQETPIVDMLLTSGNGSAADGWKASDELIDGRQQQLNNEVDVVAYMVLIFAVIALFVSVLVITNTFSILFAQRMRDFALLRAMGATRRQVLRSVRREALVLGILSSLAGLVLGTLLGWGIVALVGAFAENTPLGSVDYEWPWLVGAAAVGTLTTLFASWLPTRRLMRLSPLAALRPQEGFEVDGAGTFRLVLGAVAVLVGIGTVILSTGLSDPLVGLTAAMAGGVVAFVGVMLFGPVLVPGLVRLAGNGLAVVAGAPAKLASANAGRNPRRTAATAASLLVGVTLTTAVLTGMNTIRGATMDQMADQHPIDLVVQSEKPLQDSEVSQVGSAAGVADSVAVPGATVGIEALGKGESAPLPTTVVAPPASDVPLEKVTVKPGTIMLPYDAAEELMDGDKVRLTHEGRSVDLTVFFTDVDGAARVSPATLSKLTADQAKPYAVWVRATDAADPEELAGTLGGILPDADVANGKADRTWMELQLNVMTWSVVGMLAISVLIALGGIANTLSLSVLERAREHALLRALGLTAKQLRRTLAAEAVLLSAVAAVIGTVLGVFIAWGGSVVMLKNVLPSGSFDLPVLQLIAVVVAAGLAGLLACVVPSRRATKVSPAEGLALD